LINSEVVVEGKAVVAIAGGCNPYSQVAELWLSLKYNHKTDKVTMTNIIAMAKIAFLHMFFSLMEMNLTKF